VVKKIAEIAGFGLNLRKSLRKAKSLLRYFRAFYRNRELLKENNARKEFFEHGEFLALCDTLPYYL